MPRRKTLEQGCATMLRAALDPGGGEGDLFGGLSDDCFSRGGCAVCT